MRGADLRMTYESMRETLKHRNLLGTRRVTTLEDGIGDLVTLLQAVRGAALYGDTMNAALIARRLSLMIDPSPRETPPVTHGAPLDAMLYEALAAGTDLYDGALDVAVQRLDGLTEWLLWQTAQGGQTDDRQAQDRFDRSELEEDWIKIVDSVS